MWTSKFITAMAAAGGVALLGAAAVSATPVTVGNPDFTSSAVPNGIAVASDWNNSGNGGDSVNYSPSADSAEWTTATYNNWPTPDTYFAGYVSGNTYAVYQDLLTTESYNWTPNTTYTLSVYFGQRQDILGAEGGLVLYTTNGGGINFAIGQTRSQNINILAYNNDLTAAAGTFQQYSISYTTGATVPGGDLEIILDNPGYVSPSDGDQSVFTGVTLDASPVPEPAVVWLFAMGALGVLPIVRRRNTACRRAL